MWIHCHCVRVADSRSGFLTFTRSAGSGELSPEEACELLTRGQEFARFYFHAESNSVHKMRIFLEVSFFVDLTYCSACGNFC